MNSHTETRGFMSDPAELNSLLEKYPWFTTARIRRTVITGTPDPLLYLNLLTKPWPAGMLHEVGCATRQPESEPPMTATTDDIIDRFLAGGGKRVVPKEDTPTGDVSGDSSVFVPDEEDLDTEELERIYRDQGLELMNEDVSEIMGEVLGEVTEE